MKIIWINGPFGSGKTSTAFQLKRRLEKAFVFDPENAGFYIRDNLPKAFQINNFQDHPEWVQVNKLMLEKLEHYDGIVIVPMTVINKSYLDGMVNEIDHYTLLPHKEIIHKRLLKRGDKKGSWAFQQVDDCLEAFQDAYFETRIDNSSMSVDEVVEFIADKSSLQLKERFSPLNNKLFNLKIWAKHIRWF